MSAEIDDFKDATFCKTIKLYDIQMNQYAIAEIGKAIKPQGIISCSAIFFIGKDRHAVIHYPAGLLINYVAHMQFENDKEWYRTQSIDYEQINFANVGVLNEVFNEITERVQPTRCGVFTPRGEALFPLKDQQERQAIDYALIKSMIIQMFPKIDFQEHNSIESFNDAHQLKVEN